MWFPRSSELEPAASATQNDENASPPMQSSAMKREAWPAFAGWLLLLPISFLGLVAASIALMSSTLVDRFFVASVDFLNLNVPLGVLQNLLNIFRFSAVFALWTVPTAFLIGFALRTRPGPRFQWGITFAILLTCAFAWYKVSSSSRAAVHIAAIAAVAVLICGVILSFRTTSKVFNQSVANLLALAVMTIPCWIALAKTPAQPPSPKKVWAVSFQKDPWPSMNTTSGFGATRQVVFAGDRILVVFNAASAPYQGTNPMSVYRLLSLNAKTGEIMNSTEFVRTWGDMPSLYATDDGHAIEDDGSLISLNPDLTPAGPQFKMSRGRAILVSPDGSTMAWETSPGTTLISSKSLTALAMHMDEAVPTSVSSNAVVTSNAYWTSEYPNDDSFVTLEDTHGERLIYHGECGGSPEFLTDVRILLVGCQRLKILDTDGQVVDDRETLEGTGTFAGVSRNGSRFALQFHEARGDPQSLLYEHFVIYDTESARPVAMIRITDLPELQSWSAFSPDGHYFAVGNPNKLTLYQIP
jgi:hypothetical protein